MKTQLERISLLVVSSICLLGCQTSTYEKIREEARRKDAVMDAWKATLPEPNADYGGYPENYKDLVVRYNANHLKDPESARYTDFSRPRREHVIYQEAAIYGYSVCVMVNAKNSYGGYVGNQPMWFFIRNGEVVRSKDMTEPYFGKLIYRGRPINCSDE